MDFNEHNGYLNRHFIEYLYPERVPRSYKCSSCDGGALDFLPNSFSYQETKRSAQSHQEDWWEIEMVEFVFSGILVCESCDEKYAVSGIGAVEDDFDEDYGHCVSNYFIPKHFTPEIHLFKIAPKTPDEIRNIITSSFSLAWSDFSAAANKLRIALEFIVDSLIDESKEHESLGRKIQKIPDENSRIREMINAIKWLGNEASHSSTLKECDLAFAYEAMENILNLLYPDTAKIDCLLKHTSIINKMKGSLIKG